MNSSFKLILVSIFFLTSFNVFAVGTEKKSPNPSTEIEIELSNGLQKYDEAI